MISGDFLMGWNLLQILTSDNIIITMIVIISKMMVKMVMTMLLMTILVMLIMVMIVMTTRSMMFTKPNLVMSVL